MNRPRWILVSFVVALLTTSPHLSGQQRPSAYERVLLPIVIRGELNGVSGSRWTSRISIENGSAKGIVVAGFRACPNGCGIPEFLAPLVPPATALTINVDPGTTQPAALLFVDLAVADQVSVHARVRDVSRSAESWGTEIPSVRESRALKQTFSLLDIPVDANFRSTLRIYDFDGRSDARVIVRFFRVTPDQVLQSDPFHPGTALVPDVLLKEATVSLVPERHIVDLNVASVYDLGYAELLNFTNLPELQSASALRVEIQPVTPGLRLWAFVSVTNNDTQQVTVSTPQ